MLYTEKKSLGIDVSDHSVEMVLLARKNDGISLLASVRAILEPHIVESGEIRDAAALKKVMSDLLAEIGVSAEGARTVLGLPDSQVYLYDYRFMPAKDGSEEEVVRRIVRDQVPIENIEIAFVYKSAPVGKKSELGRRGVLVVAKNKIIDNWWKFFVGFGHPVDIFDIEALALRRGMFRERPDKTLALVDIGAATTNISVFDAAGLVCATSLKYAGNDIRDELVRELKISPAEAENRKCKFGLVNEGAAPDKRVAAVLAGAVNYLIKEVRLNLDYFEHKYGARIEDILLAGGTSLLPGLEKFWSDSDPKWPIKIGVSFLAKSDPAPLQIEATGLALRGLESKWDKTDPVWKFEANRDKRIYARQSHEVRKTFADIKIRVGKIAVYAVFMIAAAVLMSFVYFFAIAPLVSRAPIADINTAGKKVPFDLEIVGAVEESGSPIRLIKETIAASMPLNEAIFLSKEQASGNLNEGELLFSDPVHSVSDSASVIFPLTITWYAYDESEIGGLAAKSLAASRQLSSFILRSYILTKINVNKNRDGLSLSGLAEIIYDEEAVRPESPAGDIVSTESGTAPLSRKYVKIKNLDSNLNVRSGPGTSHTVISQVLPLKEYEYTAEETGWVKLVLPDGREGWVSAGFLDYIE